jgi:protein arginine kinase
MPVLEFSGPGDLAAWMREPGPDEAVVVASRVRLSRSLRTHPYPGTCSAEEEARLRDEILEALRHVPDGGEFAILYLDELAPLERRILFERGIIGQAFSLEKQRALALADDAAVSAVICEEDHLRLAALGAGSCLERLLARLDALDDALAASLPFAVSREWGYLNTAVANLGTGMRASLMLHLPALAMSGLLAKAMKATAQIGVSIRGFFGESSESLGDLYLVANEVTIGQGGREICAALGRVASQLAAWETRTREELSARRGMDLEDRVFRALGLLTHCRYLSMREAVDSLGSLRLGSALGLVDRPGLAGTTALLYLVRKAHVQHLLAGRSDAADGRQIDWTRARMVRKAVEAPGPVGGEG